MRKTMTNTMIELRSKNCSRSYYFKSWRGALKAIELCYPGVAQDRTRTIDGFLIVTVKYQDWTGLEQIFELKERPLLSVGARLD